MFVMMCTLLKLRTRHRLCQAEKTTALQGLQVSHDKDAWRCDCLLRSSSQCQRGRGKTLRNRSYHLYLNLFLCKKGRRRKLKQVFFKSYANNIWIHYSTLLPPCTTIAVVYGSWYQQDEESYRERINQQEHYDKIYFWWKVASNQWETKTLTRWTLLSSVNHHHLHLKH